MQAHIISTPDSIAPVIEKLNFSRMDEEKEHIIVYNKIKFEVCELDHYHLQTKQIKDNKRLSYPPSLVKLVFLQWSY